MPIGPNFSSAVDALGLGSMLRDQVKDETDEERKKRMKAAQERAMMGPTGSLAVSSLLGGAGDTGAY
jgi:hypothetical protein